MDVPKYKPPLFAILFKYYLFYFRSSNYNNATGDCELSSMDRLTLAGSNAFISADGYDYMENNCIEEPTKLCEFKKLAGRILKTVSKQKEFIRNDLHTLH